MERTVKGLGVSKVTSFNNLQHADNTILFGQMIVEQALFTKRILHTSGLALKLGSLDDREDIKNLIIERIHGWPQGKLQINHFG